MMIKFCRFVLVLQVKGVGKLKIEATVRLGFERSGSGPNPYQINNPFDAILQHLGTASDTKQVRSLVSKEADSTSWRVSFFPNLIERVNGAQCSAKQRTEWHDPIGKVSPALQLVEIDVQALRAFHMNVGSEDFI